MHIARGLVACFIHALRPSAVLITQHIRAGCGGDHKGHQDKQPPGTEGHGDAPVGDRHLRRSDAARAGLAPAKIAA